MSVLLRRIRGVAATGLIWCPAWAAMFILLVGIVALFLPIRGDVGPIKMMAIIGWVGFVSGSLFGIILSFAESGKAIRNLSLVRAALWGILGSAVFPLVTGREDQVFWTCPFGMVVGLTLVAVARRVERREARRPGRTRDVLSACVLRPLRDAVNAPRNL